MWGILWCTSYFAFAQQPTIEVDARFDPENNRVNIEQRITFVNEGNTPIDSVYFTDWNHSYSSKETALAQRFADEFTSKFHFATKKERGFTFIDSVKLGTQQLQYTRKREDIVAVALPETLAAGAAVTIDFSYRLQLPSSKFTRFGIDNNQNIVLREWFILPAKYKDEWIYYSNKDLDDLFHPKYAITLSATYPDNYTLVSDFDMNYSSKQDSTITSNLSSIDKISSELHLTQKDDFTEIATDKFTYVTNIDDEGISIGLKAVIHDKVAYFLDEKLGDYPHDRILLSNTAYKKNPVYGLNQLPDFIRPFPDGFQYEIKILKATINQYIKNTINVDPRKDFWLRDAIENYLMMHYVEKHYPNMKILGTLSRIWGVRSYEIAKKDFNDQYDYIHQYMARQNLDQAVNTQKDSLLKFNVNLANKNKAAIGFNYLNDYLGDKKLLDDCLSQFYDENVLKDIESKSFVDCVARKTSKDISWFLRDYINTNHKIDYKIDDVVEDGSDLLVTVVNKQKSRTPISIYQIKDKTILSKDYIDGFSGKKTIRIENRRADRLILNYEGIIPEFNQSNNTKTLKRHLFNRPLKFSFLKDAEAYRHNQIFYAPQLGYNLYDGLFPSLRFSNKTILKKPFIYSIRPSYGFLSKQLIGSVSVQNNHYFKNKSLFKIGYGLSYQQFHYAPDLLYSTFTPYLHFNFRDPHDLRDNMGQYISIRNVMVNREENLMSEEAPNYNVINLKYGFSNKNLVDFYAFNADVQFASKFGKLSGSFEFRKLFLSNRQINVRLFAGTFLYNNTNTDYFSFALDRPTDYLFDYNYYGRSEDTGLFSQQIIIAEGGFKSKLPDAFANEWIATSNITTNIWKYIFAYGDFGFLSNNGRVPFVYDSGVHVNLVPDYFELYFPVYSNLGWEIGQQNYQERIRFKVTLTPKVLIRLFTRKWL